MVARKVRAVVRLQIEAGKATPAPPVGTALGPHGVNIMGFVKEYNAKTASQSGNIIPADITIYEFFDYNCGYCKSVFNTIIKTLDKDKNTKLVLKHGQKLLT